MENIAVVILNWNGAKLLEQFLPSVIQHSGNAQIIVADNASTDASVSFIKNTYPTIEIIQNNSNGGFAKGYNDALKKVKAEFYVLLNSDVAVSENWLAPMIKAMKNENTAGCQPKIRAYDNQSSFEHAGASGGFIDKNYYPFCRGRLFDNVEEDKGQYNTEIDIFWASGACLMIRSELFHKAKGFDEDFFAHMEEIDLCWRIKKWGYTFKIIPDSTVYHVGGGTLPYSSPTKVYYNFRNNLTMLLKNHVGWWAPKLIWRMVLDGVAGVKFLLSGDFKAFWSIIRAHFWQYAHIFQTLKKRQEIKAGTTQENTSGHYKGNILMDFFFRKNKTFSKLDKSRIK